MTAPMTRMLECQLTEDEIRERDHRASELQQESLKTIDEKKSEVKRYNATLKHFAQQIKSLTEASTTGKELREVEIQWRPSMVNGQDDELFRVDTGEAIEDGDESVDERQAALPFPRPEPPVLRCSVVADDGQMFPITAEQADALEFQIAESNGAFRVTLDGSDGTTHMITAVKVVRGKACDTCGIVAPDHRPECEGMRAEDGAVFESTQTVDGKVNQVSISMLESDDYDRNDTGAVAAKISEVAPPDDKPLAPKAEQPLKQVKPRRSRKNGASEVL